MGTKSFPNNVNRRQLIYIPEMVCSKIILFDEENNLCPWRGIKKKASIGFEYLNGFKVGRIRSYYFYLGIKEINLDLSKGS